MRIRAPERRIAIYLHDRVDHARLESALRDAAVLVPVDSERALHAAITRRDVTATVVTLHGKRVDDAIGCVRRTKDRFPAHLLLVYFDEATIPTAALTEVVRLGADELIKHGRDDIKGLLVQHVEDAARGNLVRGIRDRLRPRLDPTVSQIVEHVLSVAHRRLTVEQIAVNLGIHRRTLVARLASRGYPSPQALIGWCRLLLAAKLMEERGRTLDSIALQLDFCSVSGLVNQFRRYTSLGTRELRQRGQGPFESVLTAFVDSFDAAPAGGGGTGGRSGSGSDREPLAAAPER